MSTTSETTQPRRRRFQFGLRSLLIVMTILGVALGWVSWKLRGIRHQQYVLAEVAKLGGDVSFIHQLNSPPVPPGPAWLRRLLGDNFAAEVGQIQISDPRVNDDTLALIASLPRADSLILTSDAITDKGLAHLIKGSGHTALEIRSANVTAAGYGQLAQLPKLENLYIVQDDRVDDSWLPELARLTQLEGLGLVNTNVTDAGLVHLQKATWLKRLSLGGTKTTPEGIAELQKVLPGCTVSGP